MKYIHNYNTFNENIKALNEGLIKTNSLKATINAIDNFFSKIKIKYELIADYDLNIFDLKLLDVNYIQRIEHTFESIDSMITKINGWFPSKCTIYKDFSNGKIFAWNDNMYNYIIQNNENINEVIIRYEAKFDSIYELKSNLIYHITNSDYVKDINKIGLVPKSKNKLSMHPDRIYITENIIDAEKLFSTMRALIWNDKFNNSKNKKSEKFALLEIDLNKFDSTDIIVYNDPNYKDGFYITKNIPPCAIKIIKYIG
jgi:hypothetical protein